MFSLFGWPRFGDYIIGPNGVRRGSIGDGPEMTGDDVGDNHLIISLQDPNGDPSDRYVTLQGDASYMSGNSQGGDDTLIAQGGWDVRIRGDGYRMFENAQGGDDVLIGADGADGNILMGDAERMGDESEYPTLGASWGGNDLLLGGNNTTNQMYGDSLELLQKANAGNDTLIGGDNSRNFMYGDSQKNYTTGIIGTDVLVGGRYGTNNMAGDGVYLSLVPGANDLLRGGNHSDNFLQGDAVYLGSEGGDDTLIASDTGTNTLCGDAYQMGTWSVGGDDILISGKADDQLWGDAKFRAGIRLDDATEEEWYENPPEIDNSIGGSDRFVFRRDNGDDTIHDFEQGKDLIDLRLIARFDDFDDLRITLRDGNSVIDLGRGNSVTVIGVDALNEGDFLFA